MRTAILAEGKRADVWHYRLFCDPAWEPIMPGGEVYSKEFTESGWLSYSDAQAGIITFREAIDEITGNVLADAKMELPR